mmetsp:Transcript_108551/g.272065  ORF Transcript_108551/g.272065 Transcript_108551/m.272065 type:complete len:233 (-) Transcript_108551:62-760(-)
MQFASRHHTAGEGQHPDRRSNASLQCLQCVKRLWVEVAREPCENRRQPYEGVETSDELGHVLHLHLRSRAIPDAASNQESGEEPQVRPVESRRHDDRKDAQRGCQHSHHVAFPRRGVLVQPANRHDEHDGRSQGKESNMRCKGVACSGLLLSEEAAQATEAAEDEGQGSCRETGRGCRGRPHQQGQQRRAQRRERRGGGGGKEERCQGGQLPGEGVLREGGGGPRDGLRRGA